MNISVFIMEDDKDFGGFFLYYLFKACVCISMCDINNVCITYITL